MIGSIASLAAQEVPGVFGVWQGLLPLASLLGNGSVRVEIRDQDVRLWLSLVVEYGVNLGEVAGQVQDRVREVVERMTNLSVVEVNVNIHHVKSNKGGSK